MGPWDKRTGQQADQDRQREALKRMFDVLREIYPEGPNASRRVKQDLRKMAGILAALTWFPDPVNPAVMEKHFVEGFRYLNRSHQDRIVAAMVRMRQEAEDDVD